MNVRGEEKKQRGVTEDDEEFLLFLRVYLISGETSKKTFLFY